VHASLTNWLRRLQIDGEALAKRGEEDIWLIQKRRRKQALG
jgi:hypothetical protein